MREAPLNTAEFLVKSILKSFRMLCVVLCLGVAISTTAFAQVVPPSADTLRMQKDREFLTPEKFQPTLQSPMVEPDVPEQVVPTLAEDVVFELKKVELKGLTAYEYEEFSHLWRKDIGKSVSLKRIYDYAADITARYRNDGYFLSRAYVPAQSIEGGDVTISILEGYISVIDLVGALPEQQAPLDNFYEKVLGERPLNIKTLERQILLLNDLPGLAFRTVLNAVDEKNKDGHSTIVLALIGTQTEEEKAKWLDTLISYSNTGSRYLGPHTVGAQFTLRRGLPEFHEAKVAFNATPEFEELRSVSVDYRLPVSYNGLSLAVNGGYNEGAPGYTLESSDVQSLSLTLGAHMTWNVIRSRTENFNLTAGVDFQNTRTEALDVLLSRDYIRSATLKAYYDWQDSFKGYTIVDASVSRGLEVWGASERGDADLSRAEGRPDFLKVEALAYRLQHLSGPWDIQLGVMGQFSNTPLLSSQQFGYGGQSFGRAYDSSEITGDRGIASMAELRYNHKIFNDQYKLQHFAFYDIGKAWTLGAAESEESGASAGAGTRLTTESITASLTLAQPLTRDIETPQFGNDGASPRVLFTASAGF